MPPKKSRASHGGMFSATNPAPNVQRKRRRLYSDAATAAAAFDHQRLRRPGQPFAPLTPNANPLLLLPVHLASGPAASQPPAKKQPPPEKPRRSKARAPSPPTSEYAPSGSGTPQPNPQPQPPSRLDFLYGLFPPREGEAYDPSDGVDGEWERLTAAANAFMDEVDRHIFDAKRGSQEQRKLRVMLTYVSILVYHTDKSTAEAADLAVVQYIPGWKMPKDGGGYFRRNLHSWVKQFLQDPAGFHDKRGGLKAGVSLILDNDKLMRVTGQVFCDYVNEEALEECEIEGSISKVTALRWMQKIRGDVSAPGDGEEDTSNGNEGEE
ncbi:hypothetical protein IAT38_004957 [Cryptococcus sp. DSM 104549]